MKKIAIKLSMVLVLFISLLSCSSESSEEPYVLTTIGHLADAARVLLPEEVRVYSLCSTGSDPHSYVATASDLNKIHKASLIFAMGNDLEAQLLHILKPMKKTTLFGEMIPEEKLLAWSDYGKGFNDPHVWMDISLWEVVVTDMSLILQDAFPKHAAHIETAATEYQGKLEQLHSETKKKFSSLKLNDPVFVSSHDAFHYFARAYGLKSRALLGISTESEASLKEVKELAAYLKEKKIPVVFGETSVSDKFLRSVINAANSMGHEVHLISDALYSDSLGPEDSETGNYLGMIQHNINTIYNQFKTPKN